MNSGCIDRSDLLINLGASTKLLPSEAMIRRDRNIAYMMKLTPENLLRSHYLEAGLIRMNGKELNIHWGWDSVTSEIRGTVCGHFLSAAAHLYVETGNLELIARAHHIVDEIGRCQEANGGRWAFPIPEKYLYWLRAGRHPWAPQYVCHKNMMGLMDMYRLAGNEKALQILLGCADWFYDFTNDISREEMSDMMDCEETGGILELWADLYSVTKDPKHLELVRRYERPRLADGLLNGTDMLTNMHANGTIPEILGYARAYEVTGEERYRRVVEAYWKQAVTDRPAYATGGQTCGEVWTPMGQLSARLGKRNQEHCVVYNMMRLAEVLFRWTGDPAYEDYRERALYNGIFAQGYVRRRDNLMNDAADPVTTVAYYLPMRPGARKIWGSEFDDFWCCHNTLMQANAIHHEGIFYQDGDGDLYVAEYLPSTVRFCVHGTPAVLTLHEDSLSGGSMMADAEINRRIQSRPHFKSYSLELKTEQPLPVRLMLRLPDWLSAPASVFVDGEEYDYDTVGGFAVVECGGSAKIRIELPKELRCVPLPDDPDMAAFVDGPVCLAGLVGEEHLLYGDPEAPEGSLLSADDEREWQTWCGGWKTYHQPFGIRFLPLYEICDEPYTVYFPIERSRRN